MAVEQDDSRDEVADPISPLLLQGSASQVQRLLQHQPINESFVSDLCHLAAVCQKGIADLAILGNPICGDFLARLYRGLRSWQTILRRKNPEYAHRLQAPIVKRNVARQGGLHDFVDEAVNEIERCQDLLSSVRVLLRDHEAVTTALLRDEKYAAAHRLPALTPRTANVWWKIGILPMFKGEMRSKMEKHFEKQPSAFKDGKFQPSKFGKRVIGILQSEAKQRRQLQLHDIARQQKKKLKAKAA